MQVLDAKLITERLATRSFRVYNPNADPISVTASLTDMYAADLIDGSLEITLSLYSINDFGHEVFIGARKWTGGPGAPTPQVSAGAVVRNVFLVIDPIRNVTAGASIVANP